NLEHRVRLIAPADDNASPETVTLTHSASGGNYGSVSRELVVKVRDDDNPELVLSSTVLPVLEAGSATYTVKLAT
ncbi:MAG: hypothetical protein TH68_10450, partial [Candidatus Synechococcus spongiarum 142]